MTLKGRRPVLRDRVERARPIEFRDRAAATGEEAALAVGRADPGLRVPHRRRDRDPHAAGLLGRRDLDGTDGRPVHGDVRGLRDGLVVVDTGTYWSPFGHVVIAVLIQVGGFGFMTGSTLLLFILVGRRTRLRDRMLVQASTGVPRPGRGHDAAPAHRRLHDRRRAHGGGRPGGGLRRRRFGLGTGGVVGRLPLRIGVQQRRLRPDRRLSQHHCVRDEPAVTRTRSGC